jgi:ferredoxin/protein involved in ribonucleotide reduction
MNFKISVMYFSATDTTKTVVSGIASRIADLADGSEPINTIDFTLPGERTKSVRFTKDDLVIIGVPVYAGRVPNVLLKYLDSLKGNGALAVAVVVYGNRNYDDALVELQDILESHDLTVIAGGAFIGEHAFSKTLGKNRPDEKDMKAVHDFAGQIYNKLRTGNTFRSIRMNGHRPYGKYYVPKDENGQPLINFRKIKPKTTKVDCIDCKLCAELCPMGSIDYQDTSAVNGICIKCCACIKKCPTGAKYFDDPDYLRHKRELEVAFDRRREPETFV